MAEQQNTQLNRATCVDFQKLNEVFVPVTLTGPESTPVYKKPASSKIVGHKRSGSSIKSGYRSAIGPQRWPDAASRINGEETGAAWTKPPWNYQWIIEMGIGRRFVLAKKKTASSRNDGAFWIEKLSLSRARAQMDTKERLNHENILKASYVFTFGEHYMVAWPWMVMTLHEVAGSDLTDLEVASMLGQVLRGIEYLHRENLENGHLTCSNVMIDHSGQVKITVQDGQKKKPDASVYRDIQGVAHLTVELVNGVYHPEKTNIGLKDPSRMFEIPLTWKFMQSLESVKSLSALWNSDLLQLKWAPTELQGLVCDHTYTTAWRFQHPGETNPLAVLVSSDRV